MARKTRIDPRKPEEILEAIQTMNKNLQRIMSEDGQAEVMSENGKSLHGSSEGQNIVEILGYPDEIDWSEHD